MPADPIYERIRVHLRNRIEAGEWEPGGQIPTQLELVEQYSAILGQRISLQPVKTALWMLELDGVVVRRQGKGVFVAEKGQI